MGGLEGLVLPTYCETMTNEHNLVPVAGLEPAHSYERGILNPLRLPISPHWRNKVAVSWRA